MTKIRILGSVLTVVLIGVIGTFLYQYLKLGRLYEERLSEHRESYRKNLEEIVSGSSSPERNSDIHVFLSSDSVNQSLAMLKGQEFSISSQARLRVSALSMMVKEGVPLIELQGRVSVSGSKTVIDVRGVCTLTPPDTSGVKLTTRLHIVALEPTIKTSRMKLVVGGPFREIVEAAGQKHLDKRPTLTLPIKLEFNIPVSGSKQTISFKTRPPEADSLDGQLSLNGFELESSLKVKTMIFMADGLHLFLGEDAVLPLPADDPKWIAMAREERLKSLCESGVSYFARVRLEALNRLLARITALPRESRTASFVSTGLSGNLYYWDRVHRGPFRTFLFREVKKAHLEHVDSARAEVEVVGLRMEARDDALVGLKLDTALEGKVQVHWHYDPGPGGGVGGNVGVRVPRENHELSGSVHLVNTSVPVLEGRLDGPDKINLRLSVGLGSLGNIGFDEEVPLPLGKLFSAPVPTGLEEKISFKIGAAEISRLVKVSEFLVSQRNEQLQLSGKIEIVRIP